MQNSLAKLVRDNFIHKISFLAEYTDSINVSENDDYIRVDSGLPSDTFNNIVLLNQHLQQSDSAIIEEAIRYFMNKKFPMALWSWEDGNSDIYQVLKSIGLIKAETNIAMYADLHALFPNKNHTAEFNMIEVSSSKEIEQYGDVIVSLFGDSEEAIQVHAYYKCLSELPLINHSIMKLYIGFFQNEVVSTGSLVFTKDSVGIYDIVTKRECRGKGFGSAMFNFLIAEAQKQYTGPCVLQASPDGINIYKKSGFEPICNVIVYENPHLFESLIV
ncbi:GNAT family N-acetyltransferase [Paenibacillus endoradicis]|uniref:GNAT family N-acetyltransferase n=1 Tax=Paenibacillus endoradicis TaxID=2972487 RepID=UPI00215994C4|nr:GNAT family N-acetyltransferase [Paenibacillus endoradicis]MCR8657490.1 GNAT family N-acetyltransferase [Paenibacillus endoradicis]